MTDQEYGGRVIGARLKLDPSLYELNEDQSKFYKHLTKIVDDEELKQHILAVQREAFEIHPYPCIQSFRFLGMKISRMPVYKDVLALGANRKGAIMLDIGCCFGNDPRKAATDGFPADQIVASDLREEFWALGHKLFKTDTSNFPMTFVPGDIFDDNFVSAKPDGEAFPSLKLGETITYPTVSSLKLTNSLNPLAGKISAIHTASFFHLFSAKRQTLVAKKLGVLLSPESGSIIFGSHAGGEEAGMRRNKLGDTHVESYVHSPKTWKELWENEVFGEGQVQCEAHNYIVDREGEKMTLLVWSVRRL